MERELTIERYVKKLAYMFFTTLLLLIIGVVYFAIILFVIRSSSYLMGLNPESNYLVLTSGIITAATLIGAKKE